MMKMRILTMLQPMRFPISTLLIFNLLQPFLKSTFEEIWGLKEIKGLLSRTTDSKFRDGCSLNQYVFRYWQLMKGNFTSCNPKGKGVCYHLNGDKKQLSNAIKHLTSWQPQICLNDCFNDDKTFEYACDKISETLAFKLGEISSFEQADYLS
ncbi:MAG: hypothetical protein ACRCZ6_21290 [Kluyvera sp.]|uniref:hypothetical protein n=1 Tax=Kluyvera sp. TaxID=1538228 RepID=UPI003F32E815